MPRQIIDTESSRPAYVRRQILTVLLVAILIAIVVAAVFVILEGKHAGPAQFRPATPTAAPAKAGAPPGK